MNIKKLKNFSTTSKNAKPVRIMVFGTFDILHPGHRNFFRQARTLARRPWLIVSVARDHNVKKIKGRKPLRTEQQRLAAVRRNRLVNQAVLGAQNDYLSHILKFQPAVIALGYDQKAYTGALRQKLAARGLKLKVRRLKAFQPGRFKSSLLAGPRPVDR